MMALQRNWREISLVPKGSRKIKEERMFCIFENLLATDNGKGCDDRQIDRQIFKYLRKNKIHREGEITYNVMYTYFISNKKLLIMLPIVTF